MTRLNRSTAWFDQRLRDQWPRPLADHWHQMYPQLFDDDDLRITSHQPKKHFYEWLAAIHVFQTTGALCLVEKYAFFSAHPKKAAVVKRLMTPEQIDFLRSLPNQPPDLLVYTPKLDRYWFVEVKGPTDHVRRVQANTNKEIAATLGVRVEVLNVRRAPGRLTSD